MVKKIIQEFLDKELGKLIKNDYIYNEFSLQHELGIYLRKKLKKQGKYKVQFERNVDDVFGSLSSEKKEMDIYIENMNDAKERYAIELKFPRNGQYPEQMYSFVKDIKFMEDVKNIGKATKTFVVTLVDDEKFYSNNSGKRPLVVSGIYQYFREVPGRLLPYITGTIRKPTGSKGIPSVLIRGSYRIVWKPVIIPKKPKNDFKYYFHEI